MHIHISAQFPITQVKGPPCRGCQTVTRELVALAYFSVCLRRSLVTRASREVSACVGDRLTAAYIRK